MLYWGELLCGGPRGRVVKVADFIIVLNHSIISQLWLVWVRAPHGSHVGQVKFCLRVCQVVFPGFSRFAPTYWLARLDMSEIILKGTLNWIKKKKKKKKKKKNYCVIPFQNLEIWCSYVNLGFRYRRKSLDHDDRNHCTMTCRSCWPPNQCCRFQQCIGNYLQTLIL